jgi:hypothetical protein
MERVSINYLNTKIVSRLNREQICHFIQETTLPTFTYESFFKLLKEAVNLATIN